MNYQPILYSHFLFHNWYEKIFYIFPSGTTDDYYIPKNSIQGYAHLENIPNESVFPKITALSVECAEYDAIEKLPDWIYQLENLEALSIPCSMLKDEKFIKSEVFHQLKTLVINRLLGLENPKILLDGGRLGNIINLFINFPTCEIINTSEMKKIKSFSMDLEDNNIFDLSAIEFLGHLDFLKLQNIPAKVDLSNLSDINLKGLVIINSLNKKQNLLLLINKHKLKHLLLNNCLSTLDLKDIDDFCELGELIIQNCKKVTGYENITQIKTLKYLEFLNCKPVMTIEEKNKLLEMNLNFFKSV